MLGNKNRIYAESFRPIKKNVFVSDLDSGPHISSGGIIIPDDNGIDRGIHPRWGRVWAIGPDVTDLEVGEWVLMEHGRWTLSIDLDLAEGLVRVWKIDWPEHVLVAASEDPRAYKVTSLKEVQHPQSSHHIIRSKAPIIKRFYN